MRTPASMRSTGSARQRRAVALSACALPRVLARPVRTAAFAARPAGGGQVSARLRNGRRVLRAGSAR